jgi:hypothetical protein
LTVNDAVLPLVNCTEPVVLPAIETWHDVGLATMNVPAGMVNVTRSEVPKRGCTADAAKTAGAMLDFTPGWPATASVIKTSWGRIVPLGKPEPVSETVVTPGCAALGEATGASVTVL